MSSAAPTPPITSTTYNFAYSAAGTTVAGTMELSAPMRADAPRLASIWSSIVRSAPASVSCASDGSDAVVVGSLELDVASYAGGGLAFSIQNAKTATLDMEADFGNQPEAYCDAPESLPIDPDIQGPAWGPIPIAFTIPKAYGFDGINPAIYQQAGRELWFREQQPVDFDQLTYSAGQHMAAGGAPGILTFDLPAPQ